MKIKSNFTNVEMNKNYLTDKAKVEFYLSNGIREKSLQVLQYSIYSFNSNDADKLLLRINRLSFVKSVESIRLGDIYLTNVKTLPFPATLKRLLKRSKKIYQIAARNFSTYSNWEIVIDINTSPEFGIRKKILDPVSLINYIRDKISYILTSVKLRSKLNVR
jgi:hypothetical protein